MIRLKFVVGILLTLFASVAAADSIRFDPPVATGHTSVDAILSSPGKGCPAIQDGMTVTGTTVTLRMSVLSGGGCLALDFPFSSTFHLGVLSPGVYDVVAIVDAVPTARAKLLVRDDSLTLPPDAVPATGGEFHVRHVAGTGGRVVVLVDGSVATFVNSETADDVYLAPPHAPGTVDITVSAASTS
ncbi:MAG TPA: hypothetical protein VNN08_16010, partial [Thermoanaerobaculia bacterium]|nr:hypothetical protein [Thermoanaerobaculia bacterium]